MDCDEEFGALAYGEVPSAACSTIWLIGVEAFDLIGDLLAHCCASTITCRPRDSLVRSTS
jgi:hypothetical protein